MTKKGMQGEPVQEPELRADEMLSEEMVPEHMVQKGKYTTGGFRCRKCAFSTLKQGFSGRQALRAHIKVHTQERRSWVRPLLWQGLVSAVLVAGGAAAYLLPTPGSLVSLLVGRHVPGWAFTMTGLVAVLALTITFQCTRGDLSRRGIALGWVVIGLVDVLGTLVCAAPWTSVRPHWPHLITAVAMLLVAPPTALNLGGCAYANRRGKKRRSTRYQHILKPRDEDAEDEYSDWRKRIVNDVIWGRLQVEALSGEFREYVVSRIERFRRIGR